MAPPPPSFGGAPRPSGFVRFVRSVCAGIVCVVVVAMFVATGEVQTFAVVAFSAGLGWAVLVVVARLLGRVRWRDVAGLAAFSVFLDSVLGEARRLPPRRWPW